MQTEKNILRLSNLAGVTKKDLVKCLKVYGSVKVKFIGTDSTCCDVVFLNGSLASKAVRELHLWDIQPIGGGKCYWVCSLRSPDPVPQRNQQQQNPANNTNDSPSPLGQPVSSPTVVTAKTKTKKKATVLATSPNLVNNSPKPNPQITTPTPKSQPLNSNSTPSARTTPSPTTPTASTLPPSTPNSNAKEGFLLRKEKKKAAKLAKNSPAVVSPTELPLSKIPPVNRTTNNRNESNNNSESSLSSLTLRSSDSMPGASSAFQIVAEEVLEDEEELEEGEFRDDTRHAPAKVDNSNNSALPTEPVVVSNRTEINTFFGFSAPTPFSPPVPLVTEQNVNERPPLIGSVKPAEIPSSIDKIPLSDQPKTMKPSVIQPLVNLSSAIVETEKSQSSSKATPTATANVSTTATAIAPSDSRTRKSTATDSESTTASSSTKSTATNAPSKSASNYASAAKSASNVTANQSESTSASPKYRVPESSRTSSPTNPYWSPPKTNSNATTPTASSNKFVPSFKSKQSGDPAWMRKLRQLLTQPRYFVAMSDLVDSLGGYSKELANYKQKLSHINTCIEVYCHCSPLVVTLHDLENTILRIHSIAEVLKEAEKPTFEMLGYGALLGHPIIQMKFQVPPSVTEIFPIKTSDVYAFFHARLLSTRPGDDKEKYWRESLAALAKEYGVDDYRELGICVRSPELFNFMVHSVNRGERENRRLFEGQARRLRLERMDCGFSSARNDFEVIQSLCRRDGRPLPLHDLYNHIVGMNLRTDALNKYLSLCISERDGWSKKDETFLDYHPDDIRPRLLRVMKNYKPKSGNFMTLLENLEDEFMAAFGADEPGYLPLSLIDFIQEDETLCEKLKHYQLILDDRDSHSKSLDPENDAESKKELEQDLLRSIKTGIEMRSKEFASNPSLNSDSALLALLVELERHLLKDIHRVESFRDLEISCDTFLEFLLRHQRELPPFIIPKMSHGRTTSDVRSADDIAVYERKEPLFATSDYDATFIPEFQSNSAENFGACSLPSLDILFESEAKFEATRVPLYTKPQVAINAILDVELLTDIASNSQWDLLFAKSFGKLEVFLASHPELNVLRIENKFFSYLPIDKDSDYLKDIDLKMFQRASCIEGERFESIARRIAGQTIGFCLNKKSEVAAFEELREPFQKLLERIIALDKALAHRTVSSLVLRILLCLPEKLRIHLGRVFIGVGRDVIKGFSQHLFDAAQSDNCALLMLRRLALLHPTLLDNLFNFEESHLLEKKAKPVIVRPQSDMVVPVSVPERVVDASIPISARDENLEDGEIVEDDFQSANDDEQVTQSLLDEDFDEGNMATPLHYERVSESGRTFVKSVEESREIYANINNKFGLNLTFESPEARATILNLQELAKRSIRHLSTELYSEDIHSILELTQNSDDNSYATHVIPKLSIRLCDNRVVKSQYGSNADISSYPFTLLFINNEIGFSVQNVNAICDIAKSTKSIKDAGYIGHKGIGFKSVFKLTDIPEVHSNYFHFQFDSREDILGYILPKPLPVPNNWDEKRDRTMVVLPLRMKDESTESLLLSVCEHLKDLSPSLLLFLHRLRCLEISFDACNEAATMAGWNRRKYRRIDHPSDSIVEIVISEKSADSASEKVNKWLVSQHKISIEEDAKSTTTEIAVAFRVDQVLAQLTKKQEDLERDLEKERRFYLDEGERSEDSLEDGELDGTQFIEKWVRFVRVYQQFNFTLEPHNVYAFLPLRSYGFRFTLQADWKVTSSREAVDSSSKWNIALRDEIPAAFAQALLKLIQYATKDEATRSPNVKTSKRELEDGEIDSDEEETVERLGSFSNDCLLSLNLMFHLIPSRNHVVEFFSAVPPLISRELTSLRFIPTSQSTFELPENVVLHPLNYKAISMPALTGSIEELDAISRGNSALESEIYYIGITSKLLKKAEGLSFTNPFVIIPKDVVTELNLKTLNGSMLLAVLDNFGDIQHEPFAHNYLIWILAQLYPLRSATVMEKLKTYKLFPFLSGKLGRIDQPKLFFFQHSSNQSKFEKYEHFLGDFVLDSEFAKRLLQNDKAMKLLRSCWCNLEELNEHSFFVDVAVTNFIGLDANRREYLSELVEEDPTTYLELFNEMLEHKCPQCEKNSVDSKLKSASAVFMVVSKHGQGVKLVAVSKAINRDSVDAATIPTTMYNLKMAMKILRKNSFENSAFEEVVRGQYRKSDAFEIHNEYQLTEFFLSLCKDLNIWSFFSLEQTRKDIFTDRELVRYLQLDGDSLENVELKNRISALKYPLRVIDYASPMLTAYLDALLESPIQSDFCALFDFKWSLYIHFRFKRICQDRSEHFEKGKDVTTCEFGIDASWLSQLKRREWLCDSPSNGPARVIHGHIAAPEWVAPKRLFYPSIENKKIFGEDRSLVQFCPDFAFFRDLGCINSVTSETMQELFEKWMATDSFSVSTERMAELYKMIGARFPDFAKQCKVFVPVYSHPFVRTAPVLGEFIDAKWCCLSDGGNFFDNRKRDLPEVIARQGVRWIQPYYPFAEKSLGVLIESTDEQYLQFLINLSRNRDSQGLLKDYRTILEQCFQWFGYYREDRKRYDFERARKYFREHLHLLENCEIIPCGSPSSLFYCIPRSNFVLRDGSQLDPLPNSFEICPPHQDYRYTKNFYIHFLDVPLLADLERQLKPTLFLDTYPGARNDIPRLCCIILDSLIRKELGITRIEQERNLLESTMNRLREVQVVYCSKLEEFYQRKDKNELIPWTVRAISNAFDLSKKGDWYCAVELVLDHKLVGEFGGSLCDSLGLMSNIAKRFRCILSSLQDLDEFSEVSSILRKEYAIDLVSETQLYSHGQNYSNKDQKSIFPIDFAAPLKFYSSVPIDNSRDVSSVEILGVKREFTFKDGKLKTESSAYTALFSTTGPLSSEAAEKSGNNTNAALNYSGGTFVGERQGLEEQERTANSGEDSSTGPGEANQNEKREPRNEDAGGSANRRDARSNVTSNDENSGSGAKPENKNPLRTNFNIESSGSAVSVNLDRAKIEFVDYADYTGDLSAEEPLLAKDAYAIGRWGEGFIYKKLQDAGLGYSNVIWANEEAEASKHYDLSAVYEDRVVWIEVKTTTQHSSLIPFGLSQLLAGVSEKYKESYHVFVVFVAEDCIKSVRITNLEEFLRTREKLYVRVDRQEETVNLNSK